MGAIKDVLKEELANAIRIKKDYQRLLGVYKGGSFIRKEIRGHRYYYLAFRDRNGVRFVYKGKVLSKENRDELKKSCRLRKKYKELIKKLDRRIRYLRKVVNGKEDV
ncbi:MAG: hypothetical protein KKH94_10675 [Candidatus Omnitrophica bacterium]|nr:hypothetical protein [Candidatus Omnitrophota bacterium]